MIQSLAIRMSRINIFFLLIILIGLQGCTNSAEDGIFAKNGVIDLTNIDLETYGNTNLLGEWEFYWEELYTSEDFSKNKIIPDTLVDCPSLWNDYVLNGEKLNGFGFATYRLIVKTNPDVTNLAIRVSNQSTAFNLFVNGKLLIKNGTVSDNPIEMKAQYLPQVAFFETDKTENEIILQISNNHHYKGGFRYPILIGTHKTIIAEREHYFFLDSFLAGAFLIMFFYSFGLYFFRKKDLATLYFSLLTLLFFFRTVTTGEYISLSFFSEITWGVHHAFEYISLFIIPIPFFLFFLKLFPESTNRKISLSYVFICILYAVVTLVSNSVFSSKLIVSYDIILFTGAVYGLVTIFRAAQKRKQGALFLIFGFGFVTLTILIDILNYLSIITFGGFLPIGFFVFIVAQAFALSLHVFQTEKDKVNLEHTISTVHLLSEINKQIISALNIENIMEAVYLNVNRIMDASVLNIGILNSKDCTLEFKNGICNGEQLPISSLNLSEEKYLTVKCFNSKRSLLINNIKKSGNELFWINTTLEEPPKSAIFVPLEVKGRVVGVITVKSFIENGFTNYHLDILKNIASYVAIAIDNAAIYGRIEVQKQVIQDKNAELINMNEELFAINDEMNISNEKLTQLNSFKEDLTNMIVHDLKSPLSTVINLKLIRDEQLRNNLVQQSGYKMLNLVQNILNVYKYESTKIELLKVRLKLINIINSALEEVFFMISHKSLKIEINIPANCIINADEDIIRRVFVNLLSNAVKFSPVKGIININALSDIHNVIKLSVINQGVGIPKKKQELIFERFGQVEKMGESKIGSTGLGLTFCKMAVESHEGKIGVVSESEEGVEFWFTLPES